MPPVLNVGFSAAAVHFVRPWGASGGLAMLTAVLPTLLQACGCPLYWKAPLFCGAGGERTGSVSVHKFVAMWRK